MIAGKSYTTPPLSAISYQLSAISYQLSAISLMVLGVLLGASVFWSSLREFNL